MHQQRKKEKSIFQSIFKAMLIVLIIRTVPFSGYVVLWKCRETA